MLHSLSRHQVGSPESIAGYRPQTEVDEINAIAYDQRAIEQLLQKGDASSFEQARHIYVKGAYASPYAQVHIVASAEGNEEGDGGSTILSDGLPFAIEQGRKFKGVSVDGTEVELSSFEKYDKGAKTIWLLYDEHGSNSGDAAASSSSCHVGGLAEPEYGGCLEDQGELLLVPDYSAAATVHATPGAAATTPAADVNVPYTYDYTKDNRFERTIQGFSIHANGKFRPNGNAHIPYMEDFQKFVDYYGMYDYADQIITASFPPLDGTDSSPEPFVFKSGTFDFTSFSLSARQEIITSTTAYMATGMFVIREMEHGVIHCDQKCGELILAAEDAANDIPECMVHPLHSVDSAVALYTGAVQAQDGNGNLLYGLANEECRYFKTCWNAKTGRHDSIGGGDGGLTSQVNIDIFQQFNELQHHLDVSNCVEAKVNKRHVAHKMLVPLVQGLLRSVHDRNSNQVDVEVDVDDVLHARSIAMAAAVLPVLAHCSVGDAEKVYNAIVVQQKDEASGLGNLEQFELVKSLLELHYDCMGISCQDVGGLVDPVTGDYISNVTAPCGEPMDKDDDNMDENIKKGAAFGSMFLIFLTGSVLLCCVLYRRRKRRVKRNYDDDDDDDDSLSSIESLS